MTYTIHSPDDLGFATGKADRKGIAPLYHDGLFIGNVNTRKRYWQSKGRLNY